jgi:DNA-binding transcriptional ArsR family regulator
MNALQVIAEPRRREILRLVWDSDRSVHEIASRFDITFGAVSHHLAVLRQAGFVTVTKDGNQRLYRADQAALSDLRPVLEAMWTAALDRLVCIVDADIGKKDGS